MDNGKTILVVEDNEPLLTSYAEALQSAGYRTLTAVDGYKGLDAFLNHKDEVDLILLDLMMPGVDGLEVLRTIRDNKDKYGDAPIIVLTSMASEKVIKEAFQLGATSYLVKTDMDYEGLIKEVNKFLL